MGQYDDTFGALLIGVFVAILLQGVLTMQALAYYRVFTKDPWWHKVSVGIVWVLDLAHLFLICEMIYSSLITQWGSTLPPDALLFQSVTFQAHTPFIAVATLLCQSFFLRRIWLFSRTRWTRIWAAVLAAGCIATLVLEFYVSFAPQGSIQDLAGLAKTRAATISLFIVQAVVDVLMAGTLCALLWKKSGSAQTESIVARLINNIITTSLATSLVAVGALISYFTVKDGMVFIAIHFSLGRLYTISFLATLNQRQAFREAPGSGGGVVHLANMSLRDRVTSGSGRIEPINATRIVENPTATKSHNDSDLSVPGLFHDKTLV